MKKISFMAQRVKRTFYSVISMCAIQVAAMHHVRGCRRTLFE